MDVLPAIKQSEAGIRRIDRLLAMPTDTVPEGAVIAPDLRTGIRMTDVKLRYRDDAPAQIDDLSIDIPGMTHVAIVGPNGSGKSSVLRALLGLYPLAGGSVAVGGVDLSTVDLDEMRSRVGVAFQETLLLDGSLRDNITLGSDRYSDEALLDAVRSAGLQGIVDRLPEGVDTVVGARGLALSGGEAQRVGIARALIRDPQLLLLDEVSSGLDPSSEADLLAVIDRLAGSRSIISVTHRLESARNADRILVMERGRLVEQGGFDELLLAGGAFESMWTKQHGFDVSANGLSATVTPQRLARIPLFEDLDEETLESLASRFQSELVDHGQVVFEEGGVGDAFYVIARGVVEVVRRTEDGPRIVATLADGDFFGEMALLSSDRRNATVRSTGITTLLRLDQGAFDELMASSPAARATVTAAAAARTEQNRET
jgi:ATP-binding cassette subfamily B protein